MAAPNANSPASHSDADADADAVHAAQHLTIQTTATTAPSRLQLQSQLSTVEQSDTNIVSIRMRLHRLANAALATKLCGMVLPYGWCLALVFFVLSYCLWSIVLPWPLVLSSSRLTVALLPWIHVQLPMTDAFGNTFALLLCQHDTTYERAFTYFVALSPSTSFHHSVDFQTNISASEYQPAELDAWLQQWTSVNVLGTSALQECAARFPGGLLRALSPALSHIRMNASLSAEFTAALQRTNEQQQSVYHILTRLLSSNNEAVVHDAMALIRAILPFASNTIITAPFVKAAQSSSSVLSHCTTPLAAVVSAYMHRIGKDRRGFPIRDLARDVLLDKRLVTVLAGLASHVQWSPLTCSFDSEFYRLLPSLFRSERMHSSADESDSIIDELFALTQRVLHKQFIRCCDFDVESSLGWCSAENSCLLSASLTRLIEMRQIDSLGGTWSTLINAYRLSEHDPLTVPLRSASVYDMLLAMRSSPQGYDFHAAHSRMVALRVWSPPNSRDELTLTPSPDENERRYTHYYLLPLLCGDCAKNSATSAVHHTVWENVAELLIEGTAQKLWPHNELPVIRIIPYQTAASVAAAAQVASSSWSIRQIDSVSELHSLSMGVPLIMMWIRSQLLTDSGLAPMSAASLPDSDPAIPRLKLLWTFFDGLDGTNAPPLHILLADGTKPCSCNLAAHASSSDVTVHCESLPWTWIAESSTVALTIGLPPRVYLFSLCLFPGISPVLNIRSTSRLSFESEK